MFVPEKENEYFSYYSCTPKKGLGYLVWALNGQQAIAQIIHARGKTPVCIYRVKANDF